MTAKEYLNQAYRLNEKINADMLELGNLRSISESITTCHFGERVSGTRIIEPKFVRCLGKIMALESKIDSEIDRLVDLKEQLRTAVNSVSDKNQQLVLQERYINGKT